MFQPISNQKWSTRVPFLHMFSFENGVTYNSHK
ncbi:hypothetical protein F383_13414 [Gossypium arboreum]|uniref:Uncharacterized protein n=1 Tax=Gossypium arboreum TaxID=29729 RepID=A0A0B0PYV3_GOSAR|nr:hypothetical protein F383_13414 [Gossypium arboreum]